MGSDDAVSIVAVREVFCYNESISVEKARLVCENERGTFFYNQRCAADIRLYCRWNCDGSESADICTYGRPSAGRYPRADGAGSGDFSAVFRMDVPYGRLYLALNAFPILLAVRKIGKKFTAYSCITIGVVTILTELLPTTTITYDTLLISIFGGIINGAAISMALLAGATKAERTLSPFTCLSGIDGRVQLCSGI